MAVILRIMIKRRLSAIIPKKRGLFFSFIENTANNKKEFNYRKKK